MTGPESKEAVDQDDSGTCEPQIDPKQWPAWTRKRIAICMGLFAFLEPLASSMVAPGLRLIAEEFDITSSAERNLVLSAFVLPYAPGALLLAPLSECIGRRIVLLASAAVFLIFTIACAVAKTSAQLIVFRVFSGFAGCVPLAVGVAMIGDLYAAAERGSPMAIYMALQLTGPAVGPIVGGWIAQSVGSWRWTFYVCAIATAVILVLGLAFIPETYAPKLNRTGKLPLSHCFSSLKRPFRLLGTQPIIQILAAYAAVVFGVYYLFLTTLSSVFEDQYDQSVGIASLHYLAMFLGFAASATVSGKVMDVLYRRWSKNGPFPEARIPYLAASGTFLPAGLLVYGWAARYRTFWFVPDIGLFLVGLGILAPLVAVQHYILDCYSSSGLAASAIAGMNVARFLAAFAFPLFADDMFDALGLGWGNTLLAIIAVFVGCASVSIWSLGPRLRARSSYAASPAEA